MSRTFSKIVQYNFWAPFFSWVVIFLVAVAAADVLFYRLTKIAGGGCRGEGAAPPPAKRYYDANKLFWLFCANLILCKYETIMFLLVIWPCVVGSRMSREMHGFVLPYVEGRAILGAPGFAIFHAVCLFLEPSLLLRTVIVSFGSLRWYWISRLVLLFLDIFGYVFYHLDESCSGPIRILFLRSDSRIQFFISGAVCTFWIPDTLFYSNSWLMLRYGLYNVMST